MHVVPARSLAAAAAAAAGLLVPLLALPGPAVAADEAPGAPGTNATWRSGDKDGIGSSLSRTSKVWYTLADGTLSETYYPAADTPNVRELQFAVTDGDDQPARDGRLDRADRRARGPTSLTYRQTSTDEAGRWRLTKTYVTDPARSTLMISVTSRPWTAGPYQLFALFDPVAGRHLDPRHALRRPVACAGRHRHPRRPADRERAGLLHRLRLAPPAATSAPATAGPTSPTTGSTSTYATAGPATSLQTGRDPARRRRRRRSRSPSGFGADDSGGRARPPAPSLARASPRPQRRTSASWHGYLARPEARPEAALTGELRTQYDVVADDGARRTRTRPTPVRSSPR